MGNTAHTELFSETMQALEAAGKAQYRKIYARHGAGENQFGVSTADLKKISKRIKANHSLATQLWATHNYDAMTLALMIADPKQFTEAQAQAWVEQVYARLLAGELGNLVAKTPFARTLAERWIDSDSEWIAYAGWCVISNLAGSDLADSYFEAMLSRVERSIHTSKNYVRYAMNNALISIGVRSEHLTALAIEAAQRIGTVEVDHGDTSCETPAAIPYIHKTLAHRQKKTKV
jgi:3-methyladenine DNA glycosylase AlkD